MLVAAGSTGGSVAVGMFEAAPHVGVVVVVAEVDVAQLQGGDGLLAAPAECDAGDVAGDEPCA